jgi:hypothetical protein
VQPCLHLAPNGNLLCLSPADSDATGQFAREIPESSRCIDRLALRVLVPAASRPTTYCELDLSAARGGFLGDPAPLVVYSATAPLDLPPEGDPAAARVVTFEGGVAMTVTPENIAPPADYSELAMHTGTGPLPCFARDAGVTRVFGFYPEAFVDAELPLAIPNDDDLAPGTVVDMFVLGGLGTLLPSGEPVDEAKFVAYGTATVTADGRSIQTDPGSGVPYLSWLGYRPRR